MKQETPTTLTFGMFVRTLREARHISLRAMAETLQISPAYLSEMERGTRCAPANATGLPARMLEALGIEEQAGDMRYHTFHDLAGESRGYSYDEINRYLATQPLLRQAIRLGEERGLGDAFWREVIRLIG